MTPMHEDCETLHQREYVDMCRLFDNLAIIICEYGGKIHFQIITAILFAKT